MKLLLFISLIITLGSCSDLKKSGQVERLDAMMEKIDSSTGLLDENDFENSSELLNTSGDLVNRIKGLEDDTIQLEIAYKFNRFKKMFDDLTPAIERYDKLKESLKTEKAILKQLKKDINHGDGKRHKYDEYLSFEEKKVTELESAITLYIERKNDITTTYNELHNEINELLVERFTSPEVQ